MASMPRLQVIALISGGKDSLFSILHCLANEHDIIALGNLYPEDVKVNDAGQQIENEQDSDSYMYQTVGHSVITHYADALDLPLYRRPLHGRAVDPSLNYSPNGVTGQRDEAEDLYLLLQDIIAKHPTANAVSTGAILSTYQRMRVESVAIRLNLVPLSYLWQFPYLPPHQDASLLEDMQKVGMDSRLIKVASGGLDETFLDKTVSDPKTINRLLQKMKYFEPAVGAILGEGGEFETLALSGPRPLWKKKIVLTDTKVNAGDGGSFSLAIHGAKTESYSPDDEQKELLSLRVPPILDDEFQNPLRRKSTDSKKLRPFMTARMRQSVVSLRYPTFPPSLSFSKSIIEAKDLHSQIHTFSGHGDSAFDQMQDIINRIDSEIGPYIQCTTLLLRTMVDFEAVNPVYGRIFTEALPPARVTVAVGDLLPASCLVMLTVKFSKVKTERLGLHVQSRSYWAPANIGPYSQAISEPLTRFVNEDYKSRPPYLINVAGQIPLVPATMDLIGRPYFKPLPPIISEDQVDRATADKSVALSLQHLWRIGRETSVHTWTGSIAYISLKYSNIPLDRLVDQVFFQWEAIHSFWSRSQQHDGDTDFQNDSQDKSSLEDTRPKLPDLSCFGDAASWSIPPCFAILVADLPRSAPVEWWSIGLSSPRLEQRTETIGSTTIFHSICLLSKVRVTWFGMTFDDTQEELKSLVKDSNKGSLVTVFGSNRRTLPPWLSEIGLQLIPCFGMWNSDLEELDAVVVVTQYRSIRRRSDTS